MIVPMLLKIDLAALRAGGAALARHRRDGRRQLAGQAVLDGAAGLDLHRASVPAVAAGRSDRRATSPASSCWPPRPARPWCSSGRTWSDGEPHFTLSQVALNDTIMVFAFAPHRGAAARPVLDHRAVGHADPLGRALHRRAGDRGAALARARFSRRADRPRFGASLRTLAPLSLSALLLTLVLLFGLQGEQILRQPLVIALLAVPILIQVYFNAASPTG